MADVFISYKREDREAASTVAALLRDAGFSSWFDPELVAGQHWAESIRRELRAATCVVVVWSEQAWDSRYVHSEALDGFERDALVACRIDDVRLEPPFNVIQTADLRSPEGRGSLLDGVRAKVGQSDAERTSREWEEAALWKGQREKDENVVSLQAVLIDAARERRTMSYGVLAHAIGVENDGTLYRLLDQAILYREGGRRLLLCALAINSKSGRPGDAFFVKHFPGVPWEDWTPAWDEAVGEVFDAFKPTTSEGAKTQ